MINFEALSFFLFDVFAESVYRVTGLTVVILVFVALLLALSALIKNSSR